VTALAARGLEVDLATPTAVRPILRGVDLDLAPGELLAIVGGSGAGKSILLAALIGLSPVGARLRVRGDLAVAGAPAPPPDDPAWRPLRGRVVAWMPQEPSTALDPRQTALAAVEEALAAHGFDPGGAADALAEAGLRDASLHARLPHALSGGERQRLVLALALAGRPQVLLADEPTASVDAALRASMLAELADLRARRGLGVILVTHDPAIAARADRILHLTAGGLATASPPATRRAALARPLPGAPRLALAGVTVRRGERDVVRAVSLTVRQGEIAAMLGASGSGKSTLLAALIGRLPLAAGAARLDGLDLSTLHPLDAAAPRPHRRRVQLIPQDAAAVLDARMTVRQHLDLAARAHGLPTDAAARLAEVDLPPDVIDRRPHALSGGQRQRVVIARALAVRPDALLCDEPTSALDVDTGAVVLALLRRLVSERRLAALLVTHDVEVARAVADTVWVMFEGAIIEHGPADVILHHPADPRTAALIG
jgi:peptide/nickel transport system ATP-binding protein